MAPIDRREHRQQRVRGAGPSSVQASFGFNFGALGLQPAKQSSLPPQRSTRRTPVQSTPRGANSSAQRHRSASKPRSSSSKRKSTPQNRTVTPRLGKRKRGSAQAQPGSDDGEEDELSPDREELTRSIEKSRRVVGTVSPIREEFEDVPDELSTFEEGRSTARKSRMDASALVDATPVSVLAKKRTSAGYVPQKTPIADRAGSMSVASRQSISQKSKSAGAVPVTPGMLPHGPSRSAPASRFGPVSDTTGAAQADESEDELSPPQTNGVTPRVIAKGRDSQSDARKGDEIDVDELSSPVQPTPAQETTSAPYIKKKQKPTRAQESATILPPTRRGKPPRVVVDEEDEHVAIFPAKQPVQRGRPQKPIVVEKPKNQATPAPRKPVKMGGKKVLVEEEMNEELDELSPESERVQRPSKSAGRGQEIAEVSDAEADVDWYEEPEAEEPEPTSRHDARRESPRLVQHVKSLEKPLRKRQKFSGPKHAISVMRIKGSTVRGITVADTTRTILEETIDHRLNRIAEKMQTSSDSGQRKEMRSEINLSLSFKESLNEKLLDLQDANDVLSINFKKMKLFKRDNAELRKEILALQNSRQEIALEHDDIQAEFEAEKARVETRNMLNANIYDIEAAIQNGRERARKEGREDEGPEIPLSMLLETVGRDVGSSGGGFMDKVKGFNGLLDRAAGWLEGRA